MSTSSQPSGASNPLRIAAIRFLNPAPLMWDFDHPPDNTDLAARYSLEWMTPAECADRLALPFDHPQACDIGLVPIAALATTPGLRIIPGCAIASKHKVRSILLIRPAGLDLANIHTIAADTSSRASLAYTQIMSHWWSRSPATFLPHPPELDAMLKAADAALLIGDPALFALEDQQARQTRTRKKLTYLDLAQEWTSKLSVPWVSAVWVIREESIKASGRTIHSVADDFNTSKRHGLANIETLVAEWSARISLPASTIRDYLTENIYYHLDDECLNGMRRFFALAEDFKLLPRFSL